MSALAEGTYTTKYPAARAHATTFASDADLPHPPRPSRSKDVPGFFNSSRIRRSHARNSTRRVPLAANSAARPAGAPSGISRASVSTESSQNRSTSFASNESTSSPLLVARENVVPSFSRPVAAGRCGSTPPVQPNAASSEAPSSRSSSRSSSSSSSPASAVTEPGGATSSSESDDSESSSSVSCASSAEAASGRAASAAAFSSPSLDPATPRTHAAVATGGATRATAEAVRATARASMVERGGASLDSVAGLSRAPVRSEGRSGRRRYNLG